jgi:uncharacterized protein YecE (DUF72 family)
MATGQQGGAIGMGRILVGIGGWVYAPWRGSFYPEGLTQARELEYASRQLTAIEINGTFYGAQKPASFRRWFAETPDSFVFSLKGPRFATHRKELGESGPSIDRFFGTGVLELADKLGPVLWQFPATTKFDEGRFSAFLDLLPKTLDGRPIRHVIEANHPSFDDPAFAALLAAHGAAKAWVDAEKSEVKGEPTADFVYLRLKRAAEEVPTGYGADALENWADRARSWADGRDCFVYFINGAKIRAPAGAMAFIKLLAGA